MFIWWSLLIQASTICCSQLQTTLISCEQHSAAALSFSEDWVGLGPFQIGTREAPWGADPLEAHGGFVQLSFDAESTYRSSLAPNASVKWSRQPRKVSTNGRTNATVRLHTSHPEIDWNFQQKIYGWSALQYQTWTRGHLISHGPCTEQVLLYPRGILEFYLNGQHFFGGDFYGFNRSPILVELLPGRNRIDVRLLRDVRAMGGVLPPTIDAEIECELIQKDIRVDDAHIVAPDLIDGRLSAMYVSIPVTNLHRSNLVIVDCEDGTTRDKLELLHAEPIHIMSGQTRPVAYRLRDQQNIASIQSAICFHFESDMHRQNIMRKDLVYPLKSRSLYDAHKFTFLHPSGVVSYAILKPPHHNPNPASALPLMLVLHGAGLEADSHQVRHSLDGMPDLETFALFPTGMTPWSSDDWHVWGIADVLAAIDAVNDWLRRMSWNGTSVSTDEVLVVGHSNGGQGTWFFATHFPDRTLAAVPISGYSSVENYVPYNFWVDADPLKQAITSTARASFKHELLLENLADIPILQQHGSADDNVPPYHSRLLNSGRGGRGQGKREGEK